MQKKATAKNKNQSHARNYIEKRQTRLSHRLSSRAATAAGTPLSLVVMNITIIGSCARTTLGALLLQTLLGNILVTDESYQVCIII